MKILKVKEVEEGIFCNFEIWHENNNSRIFSTSEISKIVSNSYLKSARNKTFLFNKKYSSVKFHFFEKVSKILTTYTNTSTSTASTRIKSICFR